MELLILLGFLTGWFVCWTQSQSEIRKLKELHQGQSEYLQTLQSLNQSVLEEQEKRLKYLYQDLRYSQVREKEQAGVLERTTEWAQRLEKELAQEKVKVRVSEWDLQ